MSLLTFLASVLFVTGFGASLSMLARSREWSVLMLVVIIGFLGAHEFGDHFEAGVSWPPRWSFSVDEFQHAALGLGCVLAVYFLTRIISGRRQIENRLAVALESAPAAFALFDAEDRLILCNRGYRQIYETTDVPIRAGGRFEDFVRAFAKAKGIGNSIQDAEDWIEKRLNRRNNPAKSLVYRHSDNQWAEATDLILDDGQIFTIGLNVTARIETEEKLLQKQKMALLGQLAGGIAHDFNNVLTAVIANLEVLKLALGDGLGGKVRSALQDAGEAAEMGTNLTDRLMSFSRPRMTSAATVSCTEVVSRMGVFLARCLGERYRLKFDLEPHAAFVHIDIGQFENALLNLVLNARDAMPDGGEITISVKPTDPPVINVATGSTIPDGFVMIQISDTGCGMPPHAVARAFDPFFTTKDQGCGTGLGLSMVKNFVDNAGGFAEIATAAEGTAVSIILPRIAANDCNAKCPSSNHSGHLAA